MNRLCLFELKKIFSKRITLLGLAAISLLNILMITSTLNSMHAFDTLTGKEASGSGAVQLEKEIASRYSGKIDDTKMQKMVQDFAPSKTELENLHGVNVIYIFKNSMQSAIQSDFANIDGTWNGKTVNDVFGNQETEIGYTTGWLSVSDYQIKVFTAVFMLIIAIIAPIFSGEYNGVDNLILTSQYGKTKCISAKVVAAFIAAISITTFFILFNFAAGLMIYGTEGLDCSILFSTVEHMEYIPFNITCATLIKYQAMLAVTGTIMLTGITVFISAISKTQLVALIRGLALFMLPILLPITESNPLYKIFVLMPFYHAQFISIMSVGQVTQGFLHAIWTVPATIITAVFGAVLSRRTFAKHQVS